MSPATMSTTAATNSKKGTARTPPPGSLARTIPRPHTYPETPRP